MNNLTATELREYWFLAFQEKDFETCIQIDDYYLATFGRVAFDHFITIRLSA